MKVKVLMIRWIQTHLPVHVCLEIIAQLNLLRELRLNLVQGLPLFPLKSFQILVHFASKLFHVLDPESESIALLLQLAHFRIKLVVTDGRGPNCLDTVLL